MGKGKREKGKRSGLSGKEDPSTDCQSPLTVSPTAKKKERKLDHKFYVREITISLPSAMYDNLEELAQGAARGGMFGTKNLKAGKAASCRLFIQQAIGSFAESYANHLIAETQKMADAQRDGKPVTPDSGIMTVESKLVGPDGKPVSSQD